MSQIAYEKLTIKRMIRLFCRKKHGSEEVLCTDCELLLKYATERLDTCPFGDQKTACADCRVHCYRTEMRQQIRNVMRFAGPRMIVYYPFDFLKHWMRK